MHPPSWLRGLFDWYYTRLYVCVRPERVFVWPAGEVAEAPQVHGSHLEEIRSGHSEEPLEPHEPPAGGELAWDQRIEELGDRYKTAVLGWVAPDGFPISVRLPIALDRGARRIRLESQPSGLPLAEGRACLTAHSHGADFSWQENFQVRGDLVRGEESWALVPHRLIGGFELPPGSMLSRSRLNLGKSLRFHRTARRELKERKARAAG